MMASFTEKENLSLRAPAWATAAPPLLSAPPCCVAFKPLSSFHTLPLNFSLFLCARG